MTGACTRCSKLTGAAAPAAPATMRALLFTYSCHGLFFFLSYSVLLSRDIGTGGAGGALALPVFQRSSLKFTNQFVFQRLNDLNSIVG